MAKGGWHLFSFAHRHQNYGITINSLSDRISREIHRQLFSIVWLVPKTSIFSTYYIDHTDLDTIGGKHLELKGHFCFDQLATYEIISTWAKLITAFHNENMHFNGKLLIIFDFRNEILLGWNFQNILTLTSH